MPGCRCTHAYGIGSGSASNAQPGADVIILPAGTYLLVIPGEDEDSVAAGDLDVTDTLTINGARGGMTMVDADELDRVFQVHDAAGFLSLTRLTLQNGRSLTGAGIHAVGTSVRLTSTTVRTNRGNGIEIHGSTLDLLYVTLHDTWAVALRPTTAAPCEFYAARS